MGNVGGYLSIVQLAWRFVFWPNVKQCIRAGGGGKADVAEEG